MVIEFVDELGLDLVKNKHKYITYSLNCIITQSVNLK
jgi:hypothetical protein